MLGRGLNVPPVPLGVRVLGGQTRQRVWGVQEKVRDERHFQTLVLSGQAEAAEEGWHGSVGGHFDSALMVRFCGWVA
jgi:hypothetical protein